MAYHSTQIVISETAVAGSETCYHGGAFWDGIGTDFHALDSHGDIVPADVLDAWFPPSPEVVNDLTEHLPWLLRTSPPTNCEGLIAAISRVRGVPEASIVVGAGSSDLIYRALREWLAPSSRVLLLDPTYGEYVHVLERVIGCQVEHLRLHREENYRLDTEALVRKAIAGSFDLIVLVNPNNPTGGFLPRSQLESVVGRIPATMRVWIDEAYIDYIGPTESMEQFAAGQSNVVVCKSLSKVYALSGVRAAYLVATAETARLLRRLTPPWVVGLPAQIAAVRALDSPDYYADRYRETGILRDVLCGELKTLLPPGTIVQSSPANWLICHLPEDAPNAATIVRICRESGVYLRDCATQGMGDRTLRVSVRSAPENRRILSALTTTLAGM